MNATFFAVNYETKEATWKLYILANDREDVKDYLLEKVGKTPGFRINSIEQREPIHDITTKVLDGLRPIPEPERIPLAICPWCESTDYKTFHALKIHIAKNHATVEDKTAPPKKHRMVGNTKKGK